MESVKAEGQTEGKEERIEGLNPNGFFNETTMKEGCSVKVAVRVRPLLPKELAAGDGVAVKCDAHKHSIMVGYDKQFSFDRMFGTDSQQEELFEVCVKNLLLGSFSGYNSTVLAYGQTGSGKTYTMGTDATLYYSPEQQGIVPRVIRLIFDEVDKRRSSKDIMIKSSFIEIYNEEIRDLLDPGGQTKILIREMARGFPSLCGQREEQTGDAETMAKLLERGALHRRTRSTMMNENSSRSHAIFTINIEQHSKEEGEIKDGAEEQDFMTAKFHFVDLAGSERFKKTGGDIDSVHEGISINKALFVLGKVINALTDEGPRKAYLPYRESNLTRILQDSLGGNARTTMIACVSPAESNMEETLSTLLYACRARSIKNKPVVNCDPSRTLIHQLQQQVIDLQRELARHKRGGPASMVVFGDRDETLRESSLEKELKSEIALFKRQNDGMKNELVCLGDSMRKREIEYFSVMKERDVSQMQNEKLRKVIETGDQSALSSPDDPAQLSVLEGYRQQLQTLKEQLERKEAEHRELFAKYEAECRMSSSQLEQMQRQRTEIQQLKRTMAKSRKVAGKESKSPSVRIAGQSRTVPSSWITMELDEQMKEVNEMFIQELTNSLGTLITEPAAKGEEKKEESSESAEEEVVSEEEEREAEREAEEKGRQMKETLSRVEGDIHEREQKLEQFKSKHKEMQNSLIEIMKEQYHKKVEEVEREVEKLKRDQEKAMQLAPKDNRGGIELQYKKRIAEYESKIREYRNSEARQQKLQRQTAEQGSRIQVLSDEILKMKQQKVELTKQMKKERENNERLKKEQRRETLRLKQESIKQKLVINKLTREKERMVKRRENMKKDQPPSSVLTLPPRDVVQNCRKFIEEFTANLVRLRNELDQINKEEQMKGQLEGRITQAYSELAKWQLHTESLQMRKRDLDPVRDYDIVQSVEQELGQAQKAIADIQQDIDNIEATLRYHEEKSEKFNQSSAQMKSQLGALFSMGKVRSVKDMSMMITMFFEILAEERIRLLNGESKAMMVNSHIASLQEAINRLNKENAVALQECKLETGKLSEEFKEKEMAYIAEIERLKGEDVEVDFNSIIRRFAKASSAAADPHDTKESIKFLKAELEEMKKRNTDIMREDRTLRNEIINLSGQNDKLSKNTVQLTRKVNEMSTKLKKSSDSSSSQSQLRTRGEVKDPPKIASFKEQRRTYKASKEGGRSSVLAVSQSHTEDEMHGHSQIVATPVKLAESAQPLPELSPDSSLQSELSGTTSLAGTMSTTPAKLVMCKPSPVRKVRYPIAEDQKKGVPSRFRDGSRSPTLCSTKLDLISAPEEALTRMVKERTKSIHSSDKTKPGSASQASSPEQSHSHSSSVTHVFPNCETQYWKCIMSEELHAIGIFSLASYEHYLISSSNVLKVWDINKKHTTIELPNTTCKCLITDPVRKMLIGTSEQSGIVHVWGLPHLTHIGNLDTGLDAVRTLYLDKNILFIGGFGSAGALQLWDLNTLGKLCEKEKSNDKDIFSICMKKSTLYYGGRNRYVCRLNLDTLEYMTPLKPHHYGAVNALANIDDILISGCREYLLRAWDHSTGKQRFSEVKRTTTLNAVQSDQTERMLYAAGKDGHIKIWAIKEDRLQDVGDLMSHSKSVNCLARLSSTQFTAFASGSDDRTVKIWKYSPS